MCEFSRNFFTENYCIEIEIQLFHLNVLLLSDLIQNSSFVEKNQNSYKTLKDLFIQWYRELILNGNQTARQILQSLVRWIEDKNGKFYDPELHSLFKLKLKEIFDEF